MKAVKYWDTFREPHRLARQNPEHLGLTQICLGLDQVITSGSPQT